MSCRARNSEGEVGRTLDFEALVTEFAHVEEHIPFWAAHVWTAFIRKHWHFPQKFQLHLFMLKASPVNSEFIVSQCFMRQHFYHLSTTNSAPSLDEAESLCALPRYSPKVPVQRQLCVRGWGLVWWLSRICCTSCSTENPELLLPLLHVHLMPWTAKRTVKFLIRNCTIKPKLSKATPNYQQKSSPTAFCQNWKEIYKKQQ